MLFRTSYYFGKLFEKIQEHSPLNSQLREAYDNLLSDYPWLFVHLKNRWFLRHSVADSVLSFFRQEKNTQPFIDVRASVLFKVALIDVLYHQVIDHIHQRSKSTLWKKLSTKTHQLYPHQDTKLLRAFFRDYMPIKHFAFSKQRALEEFFYTALAYKNTAARPITDLLNPSKEKNFLKNHQPLLNMLMNLFDYSQLKIKTPQTHSTNLFDFLHHPAKLFPSSLNEQILYMLKEWSSFFSKGLYFSLWEDIQRLENEEEVYLSSFHQGGKPLFTAPPLDHIGQNFSHDSIWMNNTVLIAKNVLVWLHQLSISYQRPIRTLDAIPRQELALLRERGITALWLIGIWQRGKASASIKNLLGNPEASSSAYSLEDYVIAENLGSSEAFEKLQKLCQEEGLLLATDMVPNHTAIDSTWTYSHPDWFLQLSECPYPSYRFEGPELSSRPEVSIRLEDHYYDKSDASVVFRYEEKTSGRVRYIYHGNDGTLTPWNDTAQIDFLHPQAREAVIQTIIDVARRFPIIRFDAAMTLVKKHIQRLWHPLPHEKNTIASRHLYGSTEKEFNDALPHEFWHEVVDRIKKEAPHTLLLAEAFWMLEDYFVSVLGLHRVYNSAFMNMLKEEKNKEYRNLLKKALHQDPRILERFVNFMNNPDEEPAALDFGYGDKYFGVATLMASLPGLPMIGHGQIEGFKEKYGMEYQRSYYDEVVNQPFVETHERLIFPLLRRRWLFSRADHFYLYDFLENYQVNEHVYAFSSHNDGQYGLIFFNNSPYACSGTILYSVPRKNSTSRLINEIFNLKSTSFVIFQELQSELFYIRPANFLHKNGFSCSLGPYQTRSLLNFQVLYESPELPLEDIWKHFGMEGFPSLEEALKELHKETWDNFLQFSPHQDWHIQDFEGSNFPKRLHNLLESLYKNINHKKNSAFSLTDERKSELECFLEEKIAILQQMHQMIKKMENEDLLVVWLSPFGEFIFWEEVLFPIARYLVQDENLPKIYGQSYVRRLEEDKKNPQFQSWRKLWQDLKDYHNKKKTTSLLPSAATKLQLWFKQHQNAFDDRLSPHDFLLHSSFLAHMTLFCQENKQVLDDFEKKKKTFIQRSKRSLNPKKQDLTKNKSER